MSEIYFSSNNDYSDWVIGWTTKELWFDSWHRQEIFLFSKASQLALGPTKPLFNGAQCSFFGGKVAG
jgi:hypothetical protein